MDILRAIKTSESATRPVFADLVDEHGTSVYKFCRSLAYSKEDADDLFQETFLRAFEQPSKINASDNPHSFLFSTALYIWKSWKRKYARRNRIAPTEQFYETTAGDDDLERDVMEREEIRVVRELVEALPEKFRIPIILYYTMEMSVPDIALTLKTPLGTVKSRLFKARKIVGKGLGDAL
ncbi:MAG: RNA polymerase sigma factor [Clostridiales bacterium]|nr:RNA polymerase sigma factor [Clostridiales bacterium]